MKHIAAWSIRIVVGMLFIYAGALKWLDFPAFAASVNAFGILPPAAATAATYWMPSLEIVAGAALLITPTHREAAALLGALTVTFIAALAYAQFAGLQIDCGCFGAGETSDSYWLLIIRNTIITVGLAWLAFTSAGRGPWRGTQPHPGTL